MSPSTQPPCFSLRLKQGKDITFPHWSLNVPHNETVLIIQKLDSHLSHLTSRSSTTHNFHHHGMLHLRFHPAQVTNSIRKLTFSTQKQALMYEYQCKISKKIMGFQYKGVKAVTYWKSNPLPASNPYSILFGCT